MKQILIYFYPITQFIIFLFYIPYVRSVLESETADAINVPAQFAFFTTGSIAAIYMWVVNEDIIATLIICGHVLVGNLLIALIALSKQRKYRERRKKEDTTPQG